MYDDNDKVVILTTDNFKTEVLESEDLWFVEFYAPWCGHCKKLTPEFKKAAEEMDGVVKFGALDMTVHGSAGSAYNVKGYPTLKFFLKNKSLPPFDYSDEREAAFMVDFAMSQVRRERGEEEDPNREKPKKKPNENEGVDDGWHKKKIAYITEINKDNFDELVLQSEHAWFLELYAPWCKHCKEMKADLA